MIGKFYPAQVYVKTSFVVAPALSPVNVRATDAASELANDLEWQEVYS
jgi:hypothetical protein